MKRSIIQAFLSLLVWSGIATPQLTPIQPQWVLVGWQPFKWQSPPRGVESHIKTSGADILILNPNGEFAEVHCLLIRQKDGSVLISNGDGEVVRVGHWHRDGNTVSVTSRVVYRTVRLGGRTMPEAEERRTFSLRVVGGNWDLRTDGHVYKPMAELADLDKLSRFAAERDVEH
jgi:hypothetical protein